MKVILAEPHSGKQELAYILRGLCLGLSVRAPNTDSVPDGALVGCCMCARSPVCNPLPLDLLCAWSSSCQP